MKNSLAALAVFWFTFFLLLTVCGLLHVHGLKGLLVSGVGASLIVWLSRSWWKRGFQSVKRSQESFRDPTLGNRAERREAAKRHRHKG